MLRFRRSDHSEASASAGEGDARHLGRLSARLGTDDPSRFGLLASAIAGRDVDVAFGQAGEATWTDGTTVFVDPDCPQHRRVAELCVQASLVAAGSLDEDVLPSLAGRPALARRYLALEGHRALYLQRKLIPPSAASHLRHCMDARTASPTGSLAMARTRAHIATPAAVFGTIRPRRVKAHRSETADEGRAALHEPRWDRETWTGGILEGDEDEGPLSELLSSPIGGGGAIGRLLKRVFGDARSSGGGPPGADSPTHWTRRGGRIGRQSTYSTSIASIPDGSVTIEKRSSTYPEWDVRLERYRPAWCTVFESTPRRDDPSTFVTPDTRALRRALVRVGRDPEHRHRCLQGDDVDIDAAVDACVELAAGSAPEEAVYVGTSRRRPGLSVLVLLDVSGSAGEPGAGGIPVHRTQRAAAIAVVTALHELGHRVALYAFRSQGRSAVHALALKRFDEHLDALVVQRLAGTEPGAYTRLGAAIRHGAAVLERDGTMSRRLLIVISDGLAYDHGYERAYGEADSRRALAEARRRGIAGLCLSVGADTDAEALRRVFGTTAYASLERPEQLSPVIGQLAQTSLQVAELKWRRYQGRRRAAERLYVEVGAV